MALFVAHSAILVASTFWSIFFVAFLLRILGSSKGIRSKELVNYCSEQLKNEKKCFRPCLFGISDHPKKRGDHFD